MAMHLSCVSDNTEYVQLNKRARAVQISDVDTLSDAMSDQSGSEYAAALKEGLVLREVDAIMSRILH